MKNTPPSPKLLKRKLSEIEKPIRIVAFADPHVQMDYEEGRNGNCKEPLCCRRSNEMATDPADRAGPYGFIGKCDLAPKALDDFMETVINKIKPDAVFWLGDNPSHAIWNQTRSNHLDSIKHISRHFNYSEYNRVGTLYPILGNHEGLPCDNFDFDNNTHQWILDDTAEMWRQWLTPSSFEEYRRTGCYSQLHPGTRLRIIAVNDFAHDSANIYIWKNVTNPWGVLTWLERFFPVVKGTVKLYHKPIMDGRAMGSPIQRSGRRYSGIIRGQFFGHNHEDSFELFNSWSDRKKAINYGILVTPLGSHSYHNPGFKLFYVDPDTYDLVDHDTYRLYIEEANRNKKAEWKLAYRFSEYYGYERMSVENYADIGQRLISDRSFIRKFIKMHDSESPNWEKIADTPLKVNFIRCRAISSHPEELDHCLNRTQYGSIFDLIRYHLFGYMLFDDWGYIKLE